MAIQLRRGAYENYDASKLKPAEVGVVQSGDPNTTDGKAVYIAINTNDVKRIPTADEMVDHNAEAEGIYENIVTQNQTASQLFQNTSIKAAEAEQSASSASSASASANSSMQRAETAADLLTNVTATAETLEAGQQATASYSNGVFSFGLPKGDTHKVKSMITGVESSAVATKNYSIGDLVIVGDTLYEVTAAIASGETISASNAVATTVDNAIRNRIADSIDDTLTVSGKAADAKAVGDEIAGIKNDLNPIVDLKERITWAKGYWDSGSFIANSSQKRRGTASICHAETDIKVSLSDYSLYRYYISFYTSEGAFISTGGQWLRTDFVIPKDSYYTITLGYVSSSATDSSDVKNAVYDALSMQTDDNYDGAVSATNKLSENTGNLLAITNGVPDPTTGYIYALDLGEDKTFPNGVIFSFDANDVVVSVTNGGVVDLQENDGTHHYCTYASLYDGYGNQFVNTKAQNGRFSTLGFAPYTKSITFRYCIVRTRAITSGGISNLMLTAGQSLYEYADSKTAIDYGARNLIRDDGADYLAQSVYKINGSTINPVTLLHFSDIHGDTARLTDIMAFANSHDNITDILHTGDTVSDVYSDGLGWWDSVSGSQKILNAIGNHDAITSQNNPTIIDMATIAETFIEPYVSNWGVTYTNGTTYYYKDYDSGVRLICLDCMHITDSTQLSWLQTVLDGALSASKHVVIGFHYYAYPHTVVDCEFSPKVDVANVQASIPTTVLDLVKSFQIGGGKFVCYLTGHNHYDMIVTPSDYPEQLVIGITCATNVYAQSKFGDQTRRGARFANAFNLVTINPQTNTVSVRRIGADMDMLGRERKGFGWNYASHEKLF